MVIQDLLNHINSELKPELFKDYAPNGLQVEGPQEVSKIITGVTANLSLIKKAIEKKADVILVHHGLFWKNTPQPIQGIQYQRIKLLINHRINLIAYHLPLDAHPVFGNNAQLAKHLGLKVDNAIDLDRQPGLGMVGHIPKAMPHKEFARLVHQTLEHEPLHIVGETPEIKKVAWCTGAAQNYLAYFQEMGVDAYITGEFSLSSVEYARESGIHFFAAGHHATERFGVKALGDHLAKKFALDVEFIDIPNPA